MNSEASKTRCGYVAIVGRPNVGKSTLLNHIIGQKVSITSRKPQTTRHRIVGIDTRDATQMVFVDTPGLHREEKRAINRYMNRAAQSSVVDVDGIVFVIEAEKWTDDDELVLEHLKQTKTPVILFINKVDKLAEKERLLPFIEEVSKKHPFEDIMPGSALKRLNVQQLSDKLSSLMPESDFFYPEDHITDRSQRFMAAEIIREKLIRALGQELPYSATVEIEQFKEEGRMLRIHGLILVERAGQKSIVIGKQGSRLKQIGQAAREDMQQMFEQKVHLELWVKVKDGWSDDERALRSLGYDEH